ncbi:ribosomal L7Ae/L30e/S12e/Gadd45 family protein [Erysipelothrix sp. HDW6A]|uniref:L7Ae/L30e/S12e/Gadd45 family ribosomal protein n=1 Tax=Erysipelothrix sp. HDW6A TaxID=2714928 RepID=UPI001F0F8BC7|nr:ribosomal L7Ae/L30e/S12e/Gadd45 family protein [Erysipelothrix sp. HDW6A]
MTNYSNILNKDGLLSSLGLCKRAGKLVYGDKLIPAIQNKSVKCVVLADNASERTKKQIRDKAKHAKIDIVSGLTVEEISWAIGMVQRVAVGITDEQVLKVVMKNIERGDGLSE